MEEGEVHRGCAECLGHGHLCRHCHAANGSLHSLVGSSLSSFRGSGLCSGCGHALPHHLLKHLGIHLLIHTWIHRLTHGALHGVSNGISDRAGDGIAKVDRRVGAEPLIGAEETRGVLPAARVMRTENELLRESVHLLTLLELQVVGRHVVLVHEHTVLQELIARGRREEQLFHLIADGETGGKHIATVTVHDGRRRILYVQVDRFTGSVPICIVNRLVLAIAEAILRHPLIVGRPVKLQFLRRLEDKSGLTTGLKATVVLLIEIVVVDESLQAAIESGDGEGEFFRGTMVMRHLDVSPKPRTEAQTDVGTLIAHGVLRINANESTLSILSVERSLRSAQDVHAVEHIEMVIKGGFRHERDIVIIDAHSGVVDARTDTTDVHRRGKTRAVTRHYERRHVLRELREVAHIQLLQLLAAEHAAAYGLQPQSYLLFRLRHHNHFI